MTSPNPASSTTTTVPSTCRHCWRPLVRVGEAYRPLWVHSATGRASCAAGHLPIAEPITPALLAQRRPA